MNTDQHRGTNLVFFDLETKRSSAQVGWSRISQMGLSLAVTYSEKDGYQTFRDHQVQNLTSYLKRADAVVGFNHVEFDYKVLSAYTYENLAALNNIDIWLIISNITGRRISLNKLAQASLGRSKTADGLEAIRWYKEGRFDLIEKYCREDVALTRDLYYQGCEQGFVSCLGAQGIVDVKVEWAWTSNRIQILDSNPEQCLEMKISQNIPEVHEAFVTLDTKNDVGKNHHRIPGANHPLERSEKTSEADVLTQLMEEYERLQAVADEAQAKANEVSERIKEIVLKMGKTQKSGRVIASYSKGRGKYDYQSMAAALSPPDELVEQHTSRVTDWKALCEDIKVSKEIKTKFYTEGRPSVSVRLGDSQK